MLTSFFCCILACCFITVWRLVARYRADSPALWTTSINAALNQQTFCHRRRFFSLLSAVHRALCNLLHWKFSFPEGRLAKILLVLKQGSSQKRSDWRKQSRPPTFPAESLDATPSQGNAVTPVVWRHPELCTRWAGVVTTSRWGRFLGSSLGARVVQTHKINRSVRPGWGVSSLQWSGEKQKGNFCGSLRRHGPAGGRAALQPFPSVLN